MTDWLADSAPSPWAQEWVGNGKLRATGRVDWEKAVQLGDEVEVFVSHSALSHS